MQHVDARVQTSEPASDVHQTRVVHGRADLGTGRDDVRELVAHHRRGHRRVLDREGSAKTAACRRILQIDQFEPLDGAQQAQRRVAYAHHPGGVARGVVDDPMGEPCAYVLDAEVVRDKGREFVHPRNQRLDLFGELLVIRELGQPLVVVDHHRRAGTRRSDDRLGIGEHPHEPPQQAAPPRARSRCSNGAARSRSARRESRPRPRVARGSARRPCPFPGTGCR